MSTMILTRGVPASGKSTWAKEWVAEDPENRVRVNRDNLRWTLGIKEGVGTPEQEQEVTYWQNAMIERGLSQGKDVVVDNTNLRAKFVKELIKLGLKFGAEIEHKDFVVDLPTARGRDQYRASYGERYVGPEVIDMFFKKFVGKNGELPAFPEVPNVAPVQYKPYVRGSIPAFSFDIDGTLALFGDRRSPYDTSKYHEDWVCEELAVLITYLKDDYAIIGLSGRSDEHRGVTERWLAQHGIQMDAFFMRSKGDMRNDSIVKSELVDKYVSNVYDVLIHFDDRNRVVDALRTKGMKVAQIEPGDF